MHPIVEDVLIHYGTPRHSGRYPWGSGEKPYQHSGDFYSRVNTLRKQNFTFVDENGKKYTGDTAIAKSMNMSTTDFRTFYKIAKNDQRRLKVDRARSLKEDGKTNQEIAEIMGLKGESSVRSLLNESSAKNMDMAQTTADLLRKQIEEKGMLDVGSSVEKQLNISRGNLDEALSILAAEGYPVYGGRMPQVTNPGKYTTIQVVCPKGTQHKEIYNFDQIHMIGEDWVSHDGGITFDPKFVYPASMDSKRLAIRYAEDGGDLKDGVIEIRRGVEDLDLGGSHYSQVRILVDGTHYIKGMAVYSDNMPPGVDVVFNTNKKAGTPALGPKNDTVLKPIKQDKDNPFGSYIKEGIIDPHDPLKFKGGQSYYYDKDGNKKLSLINKREDEGGWGEWSNKLSSQFLSKQSKQLIEKQLNLSKAEKASEFDEIMSLTNPTIKRAMLEKFANDCDSASVHLHAAGLPGQRYQVILPLVNIKDNEVYAPNFTDGDTVALVRYPHGGTFEIPILKVNNKNREGKEVIGTSPKDAIGINKKVADRLSGADFDGDTVMVIPCNSPRTKVRITSTPPLEGLAGFDPKLEYGGRPEGSFKKMKDTQKEMGIVSNLITDMTIKGATDDELARAVRHSMVVIDAEKHNLDYKDSEEKNGIMALRKKYQGQIGDDGREHYGAATIVSRAKSPTMVPKRQGTPRIDPETGERIYKESKDAHYVDSKGRERVRQEQIPRMETVKDAMDLVSSKTSQRELYYADYANYLKDLGNRARKEAVNGERLKQDANAKKVYSKEVASLNAKYNNALLNSPRERQAQMIANSVVKAKRMDNPELNDKKNRGELKKISNQALMEARTKVGAERKPIHITDKEWEAIQAGAISDSKLYNMLKYVDDRELKNLAMPRASSATLSTAKQNRIKTLKASGYTNDQIAEIVNVSTSTVNKYL